uniref:Apoptotic chromatin condensation inducer in the nucleus-like n=1 Tax=Salmo trutta TaxID=8032 RepID=A0A674ADU9_SALTR
MEESTTPKAFAARKISLTTGSKSSPEGGGAAAGGEAESGTAAGRKRRWGSSTAVNAKKPSISITTDSLKSLIPDIKPSQDAVVDLHPDDIQLSGDEDTTREDQGLDKGLKIRRTVTQVVPSENQENGQGERDEEEEEEEEVKKQDDTLVRRSISQQKSGVSVTIDDPVRTAKQPSPPRGKVSNIVHVCNLVRPFTLGQLKELLNRTGSVVEDGFWIDKIKSHCYVTYSSTEEAVATRAALHGVKWPQSNPKVLSVDFSITMLTHYLFLSLSSIPTDEPPAKLLDDLFNKTKAAPCIYWLPLTEEQANQRGKEREERQKERERRRKEQQEEEDKKREEERKERIKSREKEGGAAASTGSVSVRGSEGDRDRERERGREREGEKRRDSGGFRPRGPDTKPSAGFRRSRSRSNPRDKRR